MDKRRGQFLDPIEGLLSLPESIDLHDWLRIVDHDHSAYVDQWDWERVMTAEQRNLAFLMEVVGGIWRVLVGAERFAQEMFPQLRDARYPNLPEKLTFLHTEEILDMYPDLPRKQRETRVLREYPAIFIIGIGCL